MFSGKARVRIEDTAFSRIHVLAVKKLPFFGRTEFNKRVLFNVSREGIIKLEVIILFSAAELN